MSTEYIHKSIEETISYLKENPEKALNMATAATAILERGLKVHTKGSKGQVIISDMPPTVGGEGSAPTPGWFWRSLALLQDQDLPPLSFDCSCLISPLASMLDGPFLISPFTSMI